MPKTSPLPNWEGENVFLIGGGSSLKTFDFDLLIGQNTIGANQAFYLGPERCNICAFGDYKFWDHYQPGGSIGGLEDFRGWVVTDYGVMNPPPWLHRFKRQDSGISNDPTILAWNNNTGALMINLALLLGARRVFLLGYDLGAAVGNGALGSHWHDKQIEVPTEGNYLKFQDGFSSIAVALPDAFPGRQVINVTDGFSKLNHFDRVTPAELIVEVLQ